jgi:hypothetical protein
MEDDFIFETGVPKGIVIKFSCAQALCNAALKFRSRLARTCKSILNRAGGIGIPVMPD